MVHFLADVIYLCSTNNFVKYFDVMYEHLQ